MQPYVYISTGNSKAVQRQAPQGARVAIHYPDLGRTVELEADATGRYSVTERPAPGHTEEVIAVSAGNLADA